MVVRLDRVLHAHPLPALGHGQDTPLEGYLPSRYLKNKNKGGMAETSTDVKQSKNYDLIRMHVLKVI